MAKKKTNQLLTNIVADSEDFIPKYVHESDACCDLIANIPEGSITLPYRNIAVIDCGFSMQLSDDFKAEIVSRSSWAKKALVVVNAPGQVDTGYLGRIKVIVGNIGKEILVINHKERFAQMFLTPIWRFSWNLVDKLEETDRGTAGFGSTGNL